MKQKIILTIISLFGTPFLVFVLVKYWQFQYFIIDLLLPTAKSFEWPNGDTGATGLLASFCVFIGILTLLVLGVLDNSPDEDK